MGRKKLPILSLSEPRGLNISWQTIGRRELLLSLFGALCLFLSTLEYLIPKPLPFFRLGLANLPLLLAFPLFTGPEIILLTVLKVLGQALMNGTLISYVFLFSLAGSVASVLVMYVSWSWFRHSISFVGLSLLGALASNSVQIALSLLFIFGSTAWVIAPLFMGVGLGAGLAVGIGAEIFFRTSLWYRSLWKEGLEPLPNDQTNLENETVLPSVSPRKRRFRLGPRWDFLGGNISASTLFWTGIILLPAFLFQHQILVRFFQVLMFSFLALSVGKRLSPIYFGLMIFTIAVFNLLLPSGKILFVLGAFQVTEYALREGIHKGLGIVGLVMISLATVRPGLILPGRIGNLLGGMFEFYERFLSARYKVQIEHPVKSIDLILWSVSTLNLTKKARIQTNNTSAKGWFSIICLLGLNYLILFVNF